MSSKWAFLLVGQSNAGLESPYLAEALKSFYGPETRTITVAQGDTEIAKFQKGQALYQNCVNQVLQAKSDGYTVAKLFLWIGETDARLGQASTFKAKMVQFIYDLKQDTGIWPRVYFYIIGQCPHPDVPQLVADWRTFQQMQFNITLDIPSYTAITTHTFPNVPPDVPHRSAQAYQTLAAWTLTIATT